MNTTRSPRPARFVVSASTTTYWAIARFCPMIRRTDTLRRFEAADLPKRCQQVVSAYSPELLKRALSYLYTKETKSSFEIEHIKPNSTRTERFVALLQLAEKEDFCEKATLDRPAESHCRSAVSRPRLPDEPELRRRECRLAEGEGPFRLPEAGRPGRPDGRADRRPQAHGRGGVPAVVHAAAVAYGFVFLHPFEDGNGRIHRFLIHNILARRGFTPKGIMFPVSASMLKNPADYDASLEAFSRPLMSLVEYSLDEDGRMTVENDTARWYRLHRHDGPGRGPVRVHRADHRHGTRWEN